MVDEQKWRRKWFRFCFSLAIAIQGTVRSCVELDLDLGVAEVVIHLLEISLTHFFSAYEKSKKKKKSELNDASTSIHYAFRVHLADLAGLFKTDGPPGPPHARRCRVAEDSGSIHVRPEQHDLSSVGECDHQQRNRGAIGRLYETLHVC